MYVTRKIAYTKTVSSRSSDGEQTRRGGPRRPPRLGPYFTAYPRLKRVEKRLSVERPLDKHVRCQRQSRNLKTPRVGAALDGSPGAVTISVCLLDYSM
ncbi:hypothetical protein EVAR_39514_1 [Eumeta japonica]|uniref:Uncharacterized protein n=1 Tax=Eumeta variegata TaxID=151549 RepID=A0A4C1W0B3_EUMVA|nr:hypothetical protein EVAR_39514_1 [Eumeta japonica]